MLHDCLLFSFFFQECNAILFIFQVQCCQKLMLKITLQVGVNVLSATQVSLDCQNLRKILSDKGMMQPSDGTIVDRGTKGKYRVFIYISFMKAQDVLMPLRRISNFP